MMSYRGSQTERANRYCGEKDVSLNCFRKGFRIGKKFGRENFSLDEDLNSRTIFVSFLVMLIVFGLLFMVELYWAWALLIGFIAGTIWYYFCT